MGWTFKPAGFIDGIVRLILLLIIGHFYIVPFWVYLYFLVVNDKLIKGLDE